MADIREFGAARGLKFLKYVDGNPWLACLDGFTCLKEGDQITGVVRAIRTPPQPMGLST